MSLGRRPSKSQVEAVKLALGSAEDKLGDRPRAMSIWKDFRWKLSTLDGSYTEVQALILSFVERCNQELKSAEIREPVVQRFMEMHARVTEFTVEEEDGTDEPS